MFSSAHGPELIWRKDAIAKAQIAVFTKCQQTSLLHVFALVAKTELFEEWYNNFFSPIIPSKIFIFIYKI